MTIELTRDNGTLTVRLVGRLDSTTADELDTAWKDKLQDESLAALVVDLEDVDFISSKGLRVLVAAYRAMHGRSFTLLNANDAITEVLRLSGLLRIFKLQ